MYTESGKLQLFDCIFSFEVMVGLGLCKEAMRRSWSRGRGGVRTRDHVRQGRETMCAKDASMSAKGATMSAKEATICAKDATHVRQGRDHVR